MLPIIWAIMNLQITPTLPRTITRELQINPFLRRDQAEVVHAAQQLNSTANTAVGVFTAICQRKNNF